MSGEPPSWLTRGKGLAPRLAWSFRTDADLVFLCYARECGETFVGDQSGSIYRLDRRGQILSLTRGLRQLRAGGWSDVGGSGLLALGDDQISWLGPGMQVEWSMHLPDSVLALTVDPYGDYAVVTLQGGTNFVVNRFKKRVGLFQTPRPIRFVQFVTERAEFVAAAEHSHLSRHRWNGDEIWNHRLLSSIADLAVTEDGSVILLAAMNLGVQSYDGNGDSRASYVLNGTAMQLATSVTAERIAVATLEKRLYWLDSTGHLLWGTELDEPVAELVCDPFGEWILFGTTSGRVVRLEW